MADYVKFSTGDPVRVGWWTTISLHGIRESKVHLSVGGTRTLCGLLIGGRRGHREVDPLHDPNRGNCKTCFGERGN